MGLSPMGQAHLGMGAGWILQAQGTPESWMQRPKRLILAKMLLSSRCQLILARVKVQVPREQGQPILIQMKATRVPLGGHASSVHGLVVQRAELDTQLAGKVYRL